MRGGQNPCLLLLTITNALVFIVLLILNYLAGDPKNSGGLFIHGIGNVSDIYILDITPAGATFAIWGVIYAWQLVWIIYSLVSICRNTPDGPAYTSPTLLPAGFFVSYILNMITNITWLFLWDREYIVVALVALVLTTLTLYICIGISYRFLYDNLMFLIERNRKADIKWVRFAVQNGLGMYAAWVTVATLLNLGSVLAYKLESPLEVSTASTICLSILSVEIVIFVILDLSVLDKYSRYIFMPYVVLVIALIGIIGKNWDPEETNSIFTAVLLAVAGVCFVLKMVRLIARRNRRRYGLIQSTLMDEKTPIFLK